jgi:hypothetical protein
VRHRTQRGSLHRPQIRITWQRKTRKCLPPHVANAIERARIRFAKMRQMRGTARFEQLRKQWSDRFDTANAILDRHRSRVEPPVVTGSAGVNQIGQSLRDLAIRILEYQRLRALEQAGEVSQRNSGFGVPSVAVMIEEPGGLLKADFVTERVFKPVMIGEAFSRTPSLPTTMQRN